MGSIERDNEQPVHRVRVPAFDLATTEVTVGQFRAFTVATGYVTDAERGGASWLATAWGFRPKIGIDWRHPGFAQAEDHPAVVLSWNDAVAFCAWLSAETEEPYRLPSEAEWEYACRMGATTGATNGLDGIAWFRANSAGRTHPVASKQPNAWGLHDLLGNAWEWCQDIHHTHYQNAPADGTAWMAPAEPGRGEPRVLRGGGWSLGAEKHPVSYDLMPTSRPAFGRGDSCGNSGIRLARTIRSAAEMTSSTNPPSLEFEARGARFELVRIPPGNMRRGSDDGDWGDRPAHVVVFRAPIRMGKTEITVRQFRAFVAATDYVTDAERQGWAWDSNFRHREWSQKKSGLSWKSSELTRHADDPVGCVSWNDAVAFCRWLSKESGRRIRLPSEAEWEYACRAGANASDTTQQPRDEVAWFAKNSELRAHAVGTKKPNAYGVHDLLGNVSEWVEDVWHPTYEGVPTDGSAWLMGTTSERVCRGGSFERREQEFGPTGRDWYEASTSILCQGFRVVDATIVKAPRTDQSAALQSGQ